MTTFVSIWGLIGLVFVTLISQNHRTTLAEDLWVIVLWPFHVLYFLYEVYKGKS